MLIVCLIDCCRSWLLRNNIVHHYYNRQHIKVFVLASSFEDVGKNCFSVDDIAIVGFFVWW